MIDLHAHILPGIDDGAQDIAASLAMAQCYLANGFKRVVATPHSPPEMVGVVPPDASRTRPSA
jgi:protein-tyrosine phosphatase